MTGPLDIDSIEARAEQATEGPWRVDMPELGGQVWVGNRADGRTSGLWEIVHSSGDRLADLNPEAAERTVSDALFIAAARSDVPALCREVRQLRGALLDAEHRLRLLAERTGDYDPEGLRLCIEHQCKLLSAALGSGVTPEATREAATAASDMCPRCHRDNTAPWALCETCASEPQREQR